MAIRTECRDVVMRLFRTERDAMAYPDASKAIAYRAGWVVLNGDGRWCDADGVLPPGWDPNKEREALRSEK